MIGLGAPTLALIGFALVFNNFVVSRLPSGGIWSVLISPQIFFLAASVVILRVRKLPFRHLGFHLGRPGRNVSLGIALSLAPAALVLAIAGLATAVDRVHPFLTYPLFGGPAPAVQIGSARLWTLLLLAPVTEEIFFRGILLKALRESYPPALAVLFSALIFMAGHGGFRPGPLMLGLINGPVALGTGSLIPCMIFHAVSNAYGPIMLTWFPNLYRILSFLLQ
jgi:membrane protease YdiL (CAAX protease family)